ncbi:hypothetical protein BGZ63DRAFT_396839 [Mariannaea sp. PMI_226]|nr:hypothetical protein BGZ63DRAFT_396839 [Mariannaea sp. PMI_226]
MISPAEPFRQYLQERRRKESIENKRLKEMLQSLKEEVMNITVIVSWQQRLAALGEVHIKTLENFIEGLQNQPLDPRLIDSEQLHSCGQSIYTPSSLCTAGGYSLDQNQLAGDVQVPHEHTTRIYEDQATGSGE